MTLLFTKSSNPFSWAIQKLLAEPTSHFAIAFDLNIGGIVFHSNLKGAHIEYGPAFKSKNTVVYSIEIPMSLEQEEILYKNIVSNFHSQRYDFGALLYFSYRVFLKRLFNIDYPSVNRWQQDKACLCTNLVKPLQEHGVIQLPNNIGDLEIISPYKIYTTIKEQSNGSPQ